jgi:hypothetical protein
MKSKTYLRKTVVVLIVAVLAATATAISLSGCGSPAQSDGAIRCAECGSTHAVPIVYGLPGPELQAQAEAGEVILGGCVVDDDSPVWHCGDCGYEWGRWGDQQAEEATP